MPPERREALGHARAFVKALAAAGTAIAGRREMKRLSAAMFEVYMDRVVRGQGCRRPGDGRLRIGQREAVLLALLRVAVIRRVVVLQLDHLHRATCPRSAKAPGSGTYVVQARAKLEAWLG